MVYKPNVPNPDDLLSQSQRDFLGNFRAMAGLWQIDHYSLNEEDDTLATKHKQMHLPAQSPIPTTSSDEVAVYTKTVSGNAELFMRKANNGAEVQMSSGGGGNTGGKLEAQCAFYRQENPPQDPIIVGNSVNVASVSLQDSDRVIRVTFTNPISTADYYWNFFEITFTSGSILTWHASIKEIDQNYIDVWRQINIQRYCMQVLTI